MAYDMIFGGASDQDVPEQFFLCSIGSWEMFCQWAKTQDSPALNALVETGEYLGTDELSAEFDILVPDNANVRATFDVLKEKIGAGHAEEMLAVTEDDGSEE